ncbi:Serine/threonine protein kinase [Minicystis rosea]|nr:Serine/threonine protein kinase [Minicystis rosea]
MDLHPGAVIAGRYRLDRKIGSGGMGEVWAGEHVAIGVRVALKTLLPAAALDQQLVARFRREAYLLGRVRSDRVARVVDFVEDRRFGLVLVMDFVEGEPLANVLEARCLSVEETIELGADIMMAVADLHRVKVVHRDLKPDNIILEPLPGGRRRAVIVDFGVSRMESGSGEDEGDITSITQADVAVGTIPYMAPEQFLSSRDVTGAADIYAVGAILFRAVSGRHVYGDTEDMDYAKLKLTEPAPALSIPRFDRVARGLGVVVARALERMPEARFADADAMLEELSALQSVARATALDLDAATEQAPPSLAGVSDEETEESSEMTRLMQRPSTAPADIIDEQTTESGPPIELLDAAMGVATPLIPPPIASLPGPVSVAVPEPDSISRLEAKSTLASTPATSTPLSSTAPVVAAGERRFSLGAMVIGMVAALIAGLVLGLGGHRLFGG